MSHHPSSGPVVHQCRVTIIPPYLSRKSHQQNMAVTIWLSKIFVVGILLALSPTAMGQEGEGSSEGPVNVTMSSGEGDGGGGEAPVDMTSSTAVSSGAGMAVQMNTNRVYMWFSEGS